MHTLVIGDLHFIDSPRGILKAQSDAIIKICSDQIGNCDKVVFLGDLMMHRSPRPTVLLQIKEMLDSLGGELNLMARILIQGSNLIITVGPFVVIGALVAFAITKRWSKTESGGKKLDQSMLKLPLFGEIFFLSDGLLFTIDHLPSVKCKVTGVL